MTCSRLAMCMRGSPVTDLSHLQKATNQNVRFGIELKVRFQEKRTFAVRGLQRYAQYAIHTICVVFQKRVDWAYSSIAPHSALSRKIHAEV